MHRLVLLMCLSLGMATLAAACGGEKEEAPATQPVTAVDTGPVPTETDATPAIVVETPAPGETVSSPLELSGTADVYEATVSYSLEDANGTEIAKGFTTASCGTGCRGTFEVSVEFDAAGSTSGTLFVFEVSAEDGSRTKIVEIPLTFAG